MCAVVVIAALLARPFFAAGHARQAVEPAAQCRPAGSIVKIPQLAEASGVAISRRVPDRLWALNDSGEPVLFALDATGTVRTRVQLAGAEVEDWEAVAVGPCPAGSCIYVADIGDNNGKRRHITVYRATEPADATDVVRVTDVFHATYPDEPQDAETVLITADGRIHIVTKGDTGPVALYAFPRELRSGSTARLERVGTPRGAGTPAKDDKITDGAVSPDGEWLVLRTNRDLTFHRTAELLGGNWRAAARVDLASLGEPQGEGVALGADNVVYVMGEGGGKSQPGTFARLTCSPRR